MDMSLYLFLHTVSIGMAMWHRTRGDLWTAGR